MASEAQQRVLRLAGAREATPGETRRYKLLDRRDRAATAEPTPVEVTVSAACATCGKARGQGEDMRVFDVWTQTEHTISKIRNACGHVEMHEALLDEVDRQEALLDEADRQALERSA